MIAQAIAYYLLFTLFRAVYSLCLGFCYVHDYPKVSRKKQPIVSVVIPARNEKVGITKTVNSVLASTYRNLEVIVVNDGSTDSTKTSVKRIIKKHKNKVSLINQSHQGKYSALNNGIMHSKGEIIVTIDADSYVEPNAIKLLADGLSDKSVDAVVGKIVVGLGKSRKKKLSQKIVQLVQFFEYMFGYHMKKAQHENNSIYILPGAFAAIRKSAIEAAGYYEGYSKTEDFDISMKIKMKGGRISYVDDAVCVTEAASDIKSLINQRTRWRHGFLVCLLHRKEYLFNRKKGTMLTFVDFPFVLLGIMDIFLYPIFLVFTISQVIYSEDWLLLGIFYLIIPYAYLMMFDKDIISHKKLLFLLPYIPIMFTVINMVEYIALLRASYRIIMRKDTEWTNWVRVGLK